MTLSLQEAIAEVSKFAPWDQSEFEIDNIGFKPSIRNAIALALQAVASGDLIPASDARLAVAEAYRKAGEVCDPSSYQAHHASVRRRCQKAILALADTDDLAGVQALREERDALETAREMLGGFWSEATARAEAAEAEVQTLRAKVEAADKLAEAVAGLVSILDQNETKGPISDVQLMFCWLAAQDVRAAAKGARLGEPLSLGL